MVKQIGLLFFYRCQYLGAKKLQCDLDAQLASPFPLALKMQRKTAGIKKIRRGGGQQVMLFFPRAKGRDSFIARR